MVQGKKILLTMSLLMGLTVACRQAGDTNSRVKIKPADPNAKNIAFIVGAPTDLAGVATDVQAVSQLMSNSGLGYELVVVPAGTVSEIMAKGRTIGASLSQNSTVFFYFSGHGLADGKLFSQDQKTFTMKQVVSSISSGMTTSKTFKRFIAVLDSCYSGQNVNGNQAIFLNADSSEEIEESLNNSLGYHSSDLNPKNNGNLPFEQSIVVAAAQPYETSLDGGAGRGGLFTNAWRAAVQQGLSSGGSLNLGQVLESAKLKTQQLSRTGGMHTPIWKAMPKEILSESLVAGPNNNQNQSTGDIALALGSGQTPLMLVTVPQSYQGSIVEMYRGSYQDYTAGRAQRVSEFAKSNKMTFSGRDVYESGSAYTSSGSGADNLLIVVLDASRNIKGKISARISPIGLALQ